MLQLNLCEGMSLEHKAMMVGQRSLRGLRQWSRLAEQGTWADRRGLQARIWRAVRAMHDAHIRRHSHTCTEVCAPQLHGLPQAHTTAQLAEE